MSLKKFLKLTILILVYHAVGLALADGIDMLEKKSRIMALIVLHIFTPIVITFLLIVIAKTYYED
jgi:hypothetical protein